MGASPFVVSLLQMMLQHEVLNACDKGGVWTTSTAAPEMVSKLYDPFYSWSFVLVSLRSHPM